MSEAMNLTPHELLQAAYPAAACCIEPLVEIIRVNPELKREALELAIAIGINCALQRIDADARMVILNQIKTKMGDGPSWGGFPGYAREEK